MGLKLIRRDLTSGEGRTEILSTIDETGGACEIAVETSNDILSVEKLDAGLMALEMSNVNASIFLKGTLKIFVMQVCNI